MDPGRPRPARYTACTLPVHVVHEPMESKPEQRDIQPA